MELILTFEETRIIGSLIEKELTTPEYYPLTINALKNACNQKSNRNPVVTFDENLIESVLEKLREKALVTRVTGSDMRVAKYRQIFTEELKLKPDEVAVICELMNRGPQTPGELKNRGGRMFNFESLAQVDEVLQSLMNREKPFVVKLPRQPGMKESRYAHLLSGEPDIEAASNIEIESAAGDERISNLEEKVELLKNELQELKKQFEELKSQFE
ncbi:MAG: DUF480 domain-containing protein [Bacteroidetes bacterium]|nr:DUF480 domain-containing protein [Bacteroidota bacterium]